MGVVISINFTVFTNWSKWVELGKPYSDWVCVVCEKIDKVCVYVIITSYSVMGIMWNGTKSRLIHKYEKRVKRKSYN